MRSRPESDGSANAQLICRAEAIDLYGLNDPLLATICEKLFCFVVAQSGAMSLWQGAIVLTDDSHLQRLHHQHLGLNSPTDVMTFPYDAEEAGAHGGDIVISVDTAKRHAEEAGWPAATEIAFLVAHGALHLLGWSDLTSADRDRMLNRQRELLIAFDKAMC